MLLASGVQILTTDFECYNRSDIGTHTYIYTGEYVHTYTATIALASFCRLLRVYVAVGGSGGSGSAATSTDGSSWVSRTNITLSAGTLNSVAYGAATYVAINTGGNKTATSTNGIVWAEGGNLPSSTAWSSIAYGNGRFVARRIFW